MPSTAEVKTLKNIDGSVVIYPETISTAVYSPSLGTNIEDGFLNRANNLLTDNLVTLDTNQTITGQKTFTGQILTSFNNSVAIGSWAAETKTLSSLLEAVRFSSGCCGSVSLSEAYTADNSETIPTGWYNYWWSPHRTGGNNGAASGDNCNYGTLLLSAMSGGEGFWKIQYHTNRLEVARIFTSNDGTLTVYRSTSIANNYPASIQFRVNQTDNNTSSIGGYIRAYDDEDANNYGLNMVIGGTSNLIIGSGESAQSFYDNESSVRNSNENVHITTDSSINMWVNCNTIANRARAFMADNSAVNLYRELRTWENNNTIYMSSSIVRGTVPSANEYKRLGFKDQGGHNLAYLEYGMTTSNSRLNLWVLGHHLSSEQYGGIYITKTQGNTNNYTASYNANTGEFAATKVTGAVWNDYAEYRETKDKIEPGRCIKETGKGDLVLTAKRLEEGCEIVSDTFGFAIGQSKKCQTPTAATGRVLAYLYEESTVARPGQPVCSGPNGTVSLMTNEEAKNYPWCIIGTVSEIPDYDEWFCGGGPEGSDQPKSIQINGRIWIRVR